MINWDDIDQIKQQDPGNVLGSVQALPDQCTDAWSMANQVSLPDSYRDVDHLVMTGMGGSGLGARLIESAYVDELKVPLTRVNNYNLPAFVNQRSLVICSSYSGTTEETIENCHQAIDRQTKWLAVTTGGSVEKAAQEAQVPIYKIDPRYNPSGQPRMAVGYSVVGQLGLVTKLGLISVTETDIQQAVSTMRQLQSQLNPDVPEQSNQAKQLARRLQSREVVLVAADHLDGAFHTVKNQFNESAKHLATKFDVPELNHHLMEGLGFPPSNPDRLLFWLVNSSLYQPRTQKRMAITQTVIEKQHIDTFVWQPSSDNKLSQAFELIQFGSYVVFYLSLLNGVDPNKIPWVDYFKAELAKS